MRPIERTAAMAEELPVHPFTGLPALGVMPSGRIVWPVLGAAPGDDETDNDAGDGDAGDDGQDDAGDGDGLADKGKKALDAERKARREAEKARKAAEAELAELRAKQGRQDGDNAAADADKARRDAEAAANAKMNSRLAATELKLAAKGILADPADAVAFIDLSQFEPDAEGNFDASEFSEAISDLIKRKPHLAAKATGFQGSGDGGARSSSGLRQVTEAQLKTMTAEQIVKAQQEGRLANMLGG